MQRIIFFVCLFICFYGNLFAQDTIVLNGQPTWKTGFDIADQCLFYEDTEDWPLDFETIKKESFIPFTKEFRKQKYTNRPLVVQWFTFVIHNISATDTVKLHLFLAPHVFTRIYEENRLLLLGGVYDTKSEVFDFEVSSLKIAPLSTVRFWTRTEDRQNQLVTPRIELQTPYISIVVKVKANYWNRYIFLFLALTAGCLFFITVYAIYQYYLYRLHAFVWYIAYTAVSFITALFWVDIRLHVGMFSSVFHDLMLSIFIYLVPVLYTFFIGSMLQLPLYFKRWWWLVKLLAAILIFQMIVQFITVRTGWFMFNYNYYGYFLSIIPMVLLHIILLILTAISKDKVKQFLFAGLLSLLLLWCLPLTNVFSLIPSKSQELRYILIFAPAFLLLGLTVEAICFSFALSYRSKLVLIEKNKLQENYAKDLTETLAIRTKELEEQRNIREEQKIKQIETEFEKRIAETEMTALRAQMNPHFIFNCLNSIKLYTLENDSKTASEYLTVFSQLIRLVLENSRSEKVTLQKELETLRLYIELEAMRFKNKVKYQINIAAEIDQEYIEIPPLLLQPFVENAIWHGLMHKKEGGNILIEVSQPAEHYLLVEISDDGIGRTLAAEYNSKSATRQKSYGLKMTSERIDIINQLSQINANVQIVDLKDGMNNAKGTKVIIKIPV